MGKHSVGVHRLGIDRRPKTNWNSDFRDSIALFYPQQCLNTSYNRDE